MKRAKTHRKLSKIMLMHYWKFTFRSLLFISALIIYIHNRVHHTGTYFSGFENNPYFLGAIWIIFAVEMLLCFFPSNLESMGCQKQFPRNYHPTKNPKEEAVLLTPIRTFTVLVSWIILNGLIGFLYYIRVIDEGILLLISLAYSVCDLICILFFCPFQTWFMKNRCCCTCRIYNWDFAMMFTPLIFIRNVYAQTLVLFSLILLFKWEYLLHQYPERFSEVTNSSLSCAECQEKLCHHKTQLKSFWKKQKGKLL